MYPMNIRPDSGQHVLLASSPGQKVEAVQQGFMLNTAASSSDEEAPLVQPLTRPLPTPYSGGPGTPGRRAMGAPASAAPTGRGQSAQSAQSA